MQSSKPQPTETHRNDIDGLRAVAVLAVVAHHAFPHAVPGGFVGVDIFFVISGFLISGLLLRSIDNGTFSLGDFYARRIRRLLPAMVTVMVATTLASWYILLPPAFEELGKSIRATAAFATNFRAIASKFGEGSLGCFAYGSQ